MVNVDGRRLMQTAFIVPLLGILCVGAIFLALPARSSAQIAIQTAATVACNSLVAATSHITLVGTISAALTHTPVNSVQVFVFDTDAGDGRSCLSNGNGQYTVTMDAAHHYDVVYNPLSGTHLASQIKTGISGPGVVKLDISLKSGFSISGVTRRLSDSTPVGNVAIFAHNQQTGVGFGLPTSESNGSYQISLESSTWDLVYTPPPFQALGPTASLSLSLNADISLDAFLPAGTTVYGRIQTQAGQGVPGASIFAQMSGSQQGFGLAPSKEDGLYTGTLPTGAFDIQFMPPPGSGLGSIIITDQTPLTPAYYLPVTLPVGITLSGTVVCTSTGLEGVFIFADPDPDIPGDSLGGWGKFSDSQGKFGLALVPGTYRLEFKPPAVTGLQKQEFTTTLQADRFVLIDFCPIYLPLISKN